MLLSLRIENFALIDHLDLELGAGFNVFTGETGAGKSIILDAIDAALGGKVSSRVIRTGASRAILEATFELYPSLAQWLLSQEIDLVDGSIVVCSREIKSHQGGLRSRSRLNGILVNRQLMEQLRQRLVEITAQGQTLQLGQPTLQRQWLDLYGGEIINQQRQAVATAFDRTQQLRETLENRRRGEQQRLQRLDLLDYQLRELGEAHLQGPEEQEQLEQERQRLSHVVELQQQSYQITQLLYQNDQGTEAAGDFLSEAEIILTDMVAYDPQLQPILEMVRDALAQVTEVGRQMSRYGEQLEADPQRLAEVEERIHELKQICRKYGQTLKDVIDYYHRIQAEFQELRDGDQSLEELEHDYQQAQNHLGEMCQHLTQHRRRAASQIEHHLVTELKPLAMEKVKFEVEIYPIAPTAQGADQITFCFSPNPGEPLQPLGEIASGGEMSRFLLALKACFSQIDDIPTLIFDEIDVGVSGKVAGAIAEKLHQLGQQHQVLCVTHQPLVAAMAEEHFHVDKQIIAGAGIPPEPGQLSPETDERTVVRVTKLNQKQRKEELAQLASGQSAQESIAFAESLLTQAATLRRQAKKLPAP